jgi:polysaccharide biosynthesis/export protein
MRFFTSVRPFLLLAALGFFLMFFSSSCISLRELNYMQGSFDTAKLREIHSVEPIIRKGDLLSIIVFSDNPEATKIYNQSVITSTSAVSASAGASSGVTTGLAGGSPAAAGYQVDGQGYIVFQGLGKLHVEGLTKAQLKDTLDDKLKDYLSNPYYNIRFLNYKFTLLGEVAHPGIQSIPGEKINLLEAFAMAGDLTFYGRRDNVLVMRDNNGLREWARLDLTKPEIVNSPYFYLQQNDIVIVEPTRRKIAATDASTVRNISIAATVVSTLAIIYSIFHR